MATTRIADLVAIAAHLTGLTAADITGKDRHAKIVRVRQAVMLAARNHTDKSFPQIGAGIGGRDHSTIIYGIERAKAIAERDPEYRALVAQIEERARCAIPFFEPPVPADAKPDFPVKPARRPMFSNDTDENDGGLKFHTGISNGSAKLLEALAA